MWTVFKVFIEFVKILFLFYVLVFRPQGIWDPSSLARDWTCTQALEVEVLTTGLPGKSSGILLNDDSVEGHHIWFNKLRPISLGNK